MKNKTLFLWLMGVLLVSNDASFAQNLIKNPGFENYTQCPDFEEQLNGYVDAW